MTSASLLLGAIAVAQWLAGSAIAGFTTVILLILWMGGITMSSIGILGVYLAKIFGEVKRRPPYVLATAASTRGDAPARTPSPRAPDQRA
jgi:polyisoprenyl-phosphate glycosyltransferase